MCDPFQPLSRRFCPVTDEIHHTGSRTTYQQQDRASSNRDEEGQMVEAFPRTERWHVNLFQDRKGQSKVIIPCVPGQQTNRFGAVRRQGKDTAVLCQLSNFAVFFVDEAKTRQLKAPKPAVFALKSRLTRAHFEEVSQYCNFVSVKSVDDSFGWISCITEAGVSRSLSQLST